MARWTRPGHAITRCHAPAVHFIRGRRVTLEGVLAEHDVPTGRMPPLVFGEGGTIYDVCAPYIYLTATVISGGLTGRTFTWEIVSGPLNPIDVDDNDPLTVAIDRTASTDTFVIRCYADKGESSEAYVEFTVSDEIFDRVVLSPPQAHVSDLVHLPGIGVVADYVLLAPQLSVDLLLNDSYIANGLPKQYMMLWRMPFSYATPYFIGAVDVSKAYGGTTIERWFKGAWVAVGAEIPHHNGGVIAVTPGQTYRAVTRYTYKSSTAYVASTPRRAYPADSNKYGLGGLPGASRFLPVPGVRLGPMPSVVRLNPYPPRQLMEDHALFVGYVGVERADITAVRLSGLPKEYVESALIDTGDTPVCISSLSVTRSSGSGVG